MSKEFDLENLTNGWISNDELDEQTLDAIKKILQEHDDEYCTPQKEDIFNAFYKDKINNIPLKPEDVKVLILGQDPYPDKDKAHGYAFSFGNNKKPATYSLKKIFDSLKFDIKTKNTNLTNWAKQGVLLLNTSLTYHNLYIEKQISTKDKKKYKYEQDKIQKTHLQAWEPFIIEIIKKVITANVNTPLVMFLWGTYSQNIVFEVFRNLENCISLDTKCILSQNDIIKQKGKLGYIKLQYNKRPILILQCSHPQAREKDNTFKIQAPLQFEQCNEFLGEPINW